LDRDEETPIGKWSKKLDIQIGTSSANAMRASRPTSLHHRPDIRMLPCLLLHHSKKSLVIPGAPI
jgi:hypothetical protein